MQTKIEAKWLDIDKDELRVKLKKIGAELVESERLMVRSVYDFLPINRLKPRKAGYACVMRAIR